MIFLVAGVVAAQSAPPRMEIPAIAKAANGAIVSIVMSDKDGHALAQGSGFLISKHGLIVTNYHVIENGSSAIVKLPNGAFFIVDGVLAFDKARDVAVIKAHGENFRALTLGNSDQVQVGEEVVAIGSPLSLESTVSNGIVSGIRTAQEEGGKFLQVTTPISPGSSGGPLFNMAGEVVGITTLYLKGGENLNFAIPINDAKRLLLAKSSKIQDLPNETDSVEAQTPGRDAPSARGYYNELKAKHALNRRMDVSVCFTGDRGEDTFFTVMARGSDILDQMLKDGETPSEDMLSRKDTLIVETFNKGVSNGSNSFNPTGTHGIDYDIEFLQPFHGKRSYSVNWATGRYWMRTYDIAKSETQPAYQESGKCEFIHPVQ
jgi:S1-C subfamily serine protease